MKNNFAVEVNSHVCEEMPNITKKIIKNCSNKKIKILKDNFDNFYYGGDIDSEVKGSIDKLMGEAKQFVFNKLYVDYYGRYGQDVGRGTIKQKLKELIASDDMKEAVSTVIDNIEISAEPSTYLEKIKAFFGICAHSAA